MKLLFDEPQRQSVTPQTAAGLLVGNRHVVVIGAEAVEEHRTFIDDLTRILPGQCLTHVAQAQYRWVPHDEFRVVVASVTDPRCPRSSPCSCPTTQPTGWRRSRAKSPATAACPVYPLRIPRPQRGGKAGSNKRDSPTLLLPC
jgi:hypothetical protein